MNSYEAVLPFSVLPPGPLDLNPTQIADANGDKVLVCFEDDDGDDLIAHCDRKYSEQKIDADPSFICPCGRLGQRMTYCTPKRAGLT